MHKINLLTLLLISSLAASPVRAGPTENCSIPPPDASGYNVIGDAYEVGVVKKVSSSNETSAYQ